jgi:serine/threonine protein kinase
MSTEPLWDPRPGHRVGPPGDPDRYELVERVGRRGGEGEVWQALRADEAERADRPEVHYAIKMLAPLKKMGDASALAERWMNSVRVLQGRRIPGLCRVFEGFEGSLPHAPGDRPRPTTWYLVMEWVWGPNYDTYLQQHPGVILPLANVAVGLDQLHAEDHVHGDVKPANIKITADEGRIPQSKLVDISLIRQVTGQPTAFIVGTEGYADPALEQGRTYTPISDLYGFAAMLCFALGKVSPADGIDASIAALRAAADGEGVERIVGALDPDPDRRSELARYEQGDLAGWLQEVAFDVGVVSQQQQRAVAETIHMASRRIEPPPEPSFLDQAASVLLDRSAFVLIAAGVSLAGFILGLILVASLLAR